MGNVWEQNAQRLKDEAIRLGLDVNSDTEMEKLHSTSECFIDMPEHTYNSVVMCARELKSRKIRLAKKVF